MENDFQGNIFCLGKSQGILSREVCMNPIRNEKENKWIVNRSLRPSWIKANYVWEVNFLLCIVLNPDAHLKHFCEMKDEM
jgi:hypothetical protein